MIALALFAVIIVPVMRSFVTAMKVNRRARETMNATDVAQSIMEGFAGKTYKDVYESIKKLPTGFDLSIAKINDDGYLALSTINDNYYNSGTTTGKVYNGGWSSHITAITQDGFTQSGVLPFDKTMVETAVDLLRTDHYGDVKKPYENTWSPVAGATNIYTSDKCIYYGTSTEHYSDGTPIMAYLLYTMIEKDNQFYDATVTFRPTSTTMFKKDDTDVNEKTEFFSYEVVVSVYKYEFDPATDTFVSRFDDTPEGAGNIEGTPAAVMVSGIMNK